MNHYFTMSTISNKKLANPFVIAWILGLLFYFLEYAVRSAPSIMIPQLVDAFGTTTVGVSSIVGTYYITYSITSLLAGLLIDKIGVKSPLIAGTVILGIGCSFFAISDIYTGYTGRLLQGMGSAIAFPSCVYLAARAFSPKKLATAIGITQTLGMLGGSAGQFVSAPLLKGGLSLAALWIIIGVISIIIGGLIAYITPTDKIAKDASIPKHGLFTPYKIVFTNPQSYLSGLVSGLLFAPTTIFAMTWGVAFFQSGRGLTFSDATLACAIVPVGWAIGCPLLGWLADKIGRRVPVLAGGAVVMIIALAQLFYFPTLLPTYISTLFLGIASGAAMIPYSVIKEVNPDMVKGSATGAINFITFGVTSLLAPLFAYLYGNTLQTSIDKEQHLQGAGLFFIIGIGFALIICIFLKETGSNAKKTLSQLL